MLPTLLHPVCHHLPLLSAIASASCYATAQLLCRGAVVDHFEFTLASMLYNGGVLHFLFELVDRLLIAAVTMSGMSSQNHKAKFADEGKVAQVTTRISKSLHSQKMSLVFIRRASMDKALFI